jgi:protein involved in polysaccharide export with SLBB domain
MISRRRLALALSLLALGSGASRPARAGSDGYTLDSEDIILIEVSRHADVSRTVKIPVDGQLRLPRLSQPVVVRGKTCEELVAILTKQLQTEGKLRLKSGQVQISLVERRPRRVYLRGSGIGGSQVDLVPGWRISELLASTGRVPQPERVTAILTNPRRPNAQVIDLATIYQDPSSPANVVVQEGDTLTIDLPKPKRLFVTGTGLPLGEHELDERFGLRQALVKLGAVIRDNPGDLKNAILKRRAKPGDPNSPITRIPVDLNALLTDESVVDVLIADMDTLEVIPLNNYVYMYLADQQAKKIPLPQDRKTHLFDVITQVGGIPGASKINSVTLWRGLPEGKPRQQNVDLGKFFKTGDPNSNPEMQPEDVVIIAPNRRRDPFQLLWSGVGVVQALQYFRGLKF